MNLRVIMDEYAILGTGIRPYAIGRAVLSRHAGVRYGNTYITGLYRDYLSILYLPLIPMGLAGEAAEGSRISLDRREIAKLLSFMSAQYGTKSARREASLMRIRKSWLLALLLAVLGGIAGWVSVGWHISVFLKILGSIVGCGFANRLFIALIGPRR
jgi:hypothetical protein